MKAAEMVKDESWLAEMVKDKSLTESPLSVALNCRKIKREISSTWLVNNVKNKYQRSSTGFENFGLCWKVTYKNCCFQSKQSSACIEEGSKMSLVGWSLNYFDTVLDFILFWRSKQAQMSNCPLRFARENKKLLADSMRLEQVGESIIDNEKARNEKWIEH